MGLSSSHQAYSPERQLSSPAGRRAAGGGTPLAAGTRHYLSGYYQPTTADRRAHLTHPTDCATVLACRVVHHLPPWGTPIPTLHTLHPQSPPSPATRQFRRHSASKS